MHFSDKFLQKMFTVDLTGVKVLCILFTIKFYRYLHYA